MENGDIFIYLYIYIARCQVVVKLYRDIHFGYSPRYRSGEDWTDIDIKFNCGNHHKVTRALYRRPEM